MKKKVMLIDGNSIVNRAYYGVPLLSNSEGLYTNAVYGFLNILFKLIDDEKPDCLGVAFDLRSPTFRHEKYKDYKGTRKGMPEELVGQIPILKEVLTGFKIKQFSMEGYEADDILGTLSKRAEDLGMEAIVVSGDKDLLQLASDTLKIKIPKTKGGKTEVEDYFADDVLGKYGVTPKEFIDVKALMGDASDNIPGVPSIGEKTATKIIQEYGNIENAIENADKVTPKRASENLKEFKDQAVLSKFLATIALDVPVEADFDDMPMPDKNAISENAYQLLKKYEFKNLISRFSVEEVKQLSFFSEYQILDANSKIREYVKAVGNNSSYCLFMKENRICGVSLYCENNGGAFVKVPEESKDTVLKELQTFFENEKIKKIGHNVKKNIEVLKEHDIDLKGVIFDTAIAAYILNPTRDTYNCDDISNEYLNQPIKSEEEVLGKGKSKKNVLSLDEDTLLSWAAPQGEIIFNSKEKMEEKLVENKQKDLFYNMELPLVFVLSSMEKWGIKIDELELIKYQKRLEIEIEELTKSIYSLSGEAFNINSPKQLGVILFEKLSLKGGKKTKTGYSTAADVLEKLKNEHPLIEKVLLYRHLTKLKSTYADGLLSVMDKKTGKIHSTFNQTITATGRISSTEPNLQNIPVRLELGRELRKVFVPSDDEYVFLDADYSQIELRVLAHMADDEILIEAFKAGQDIHRLTASQVFNVPFDEVTKKQRSNAKAVNFGIVYGIGAFSLSQDLGITRKEAEAYIESYFAKYPKIKEYMNTTIKNAENNGFVSTIFGRRRPMPELKASNFIQRSFGERVAMNMPIQGSAADIIKIAMVKVYDELKARKLKSRLILQIHDELLIEAHKSEVDEVSKLLKTCMEDAVSLSVPIEVEIKMGNTWYETK